jgi:predicted ATPase
MGRPIDKITLKGFKSIRALEDFELRQVNILIGANGSGKSNFVSFFSLLREMVEGRLERAVNKAGRADALLFLGPKVTEKIEATLRFEINGYQFTLERTVDNRLIFADERVHFFGSPNRFPAHPSLGSGHSESNLKKSIKDGRNPRVSEFVYEAVSSWTVYHFHDTSETAKMRGEWTVRDNERLLPDGANLAAFLLRLREEEEATYELLIETVRLIAPFFDDFRLRPKKRKDDQVVQLEWRQQGSEYPFLPSQLSDGTLRFIAMATALLQPDPPATILIDEPELGLHPFALDMLANLILQAQDRMQLIVSTQSPLLLNAFEPEQIVVIDRDEGESHFERLSRKGLKVWLAEEYTLGDLWQKNVYGGGPVHEAGHRGR